MSGGPIYENKFSLGTLLVVAGGITTLFTAYGMLIQPIRAQEVEKAIIKSDLAVLRAEFVAHKLNQERHNANVERQLEILVSRKP